MYVQKIETAVPSHAQALTGDECLVYHQQARNHHLIQLSSHFQIQGGTQRDEMKRNKGHSRENPWEQGSPVGFLSVTGSHSLDFNAESFHLASRIEWSDGNISPDIGSSANTIFDDNKMLRPTSEPQRT